MKTSKVVLLAHELLIKLIEPTDIIIDATLGNGLDTLFLASKVQSIYGFDIQNDAIINSKKILANYENVTLINDSHLNYQDYIQNYNGVIFNLGYLPGGNKAITTNADITIKTVNQFVNEQMARFILIVVYPKHPEGSIESKCLQQTIKKISNYEINLYNYNENEITDYIILLQKKD